MSAGSTPHRTIHPEGWRPPRGFTHGMLTPAGCRLLLIAGQVGWDAEERLVSDLLHEQFARALANVVEVLRTAGGRPEHLVRLTYFVTSCDEYRAQSREIGEHYRALIGRHYPASTLVEVKALLEPGARIEIEATASIPEDSIPGGRQP